MSRRNPADDYSEEDEVESPSHVQDEIPRQELGLLRFAPSSDEATSRSGSRRPPSPPGSPRGSAGRGGQLRYSDLAIETALADPAHLHPAPPPDRGVLDVALRADGPRSARARSDDALAARPAPQAHPSSSPTGRTHAPHRRQHGTLDSRRRRMGRRETRRTRHAWLEEAPCCGHPIGCESSPKS